MVKRASARLVEDFPEYVELHGLLALAAETWPRFGISAGELAEMDDMTLEMIKVLVDG